MKNEQVIEYFKFQRKKFCEDYLNFCPKDSVAYIATIKEKEFYDLAIKALEEQQPSEDCISRKAVTDTSICVGISCNECSFNTCEDGQSGCLLKERVDKLPSITPERPKGKWIHPYKSDIACECSVCHIQMPITEYFHYCPNCGAEMSGGV